MTKDGRNPSLQDQSIHELQVSGLNLTVARAEAAMTMTCIGMHDSCNGKIQVHSTVLPYGGS